MAQIRCIRVCMTDWQCCKMRLHQKIVLFRPHVYISSCPKTSMGSFSLKLSRIRRNGPTQSAVPFRGRDRGIPFYTQNPHVFIRVALSKK